MSYHRYELQCFSVQSVFCRLILMTLCVFLGQLHIKQSQSSPGRSLLGTRGYKFLHIMYSLSSAQVCTQVFTDC